ncbi:helix-turn-helix domain-containing protein [Paenibacillus sp. GCM10023252]|uniref:helix-turn-helix domain-containing protein n=1 Tax=Paenibacillus sp. GCM10023252 TaxID=3252649 RepID=UPI0036188076
MNKLQLPQVHHLGDVIVKPGFTIPMREIPDYELVYFPEARQSVYQLGVKEYRIPTPSMVLTKPGEKHAYQFDTHQPTRHLFVHFGFKTAAHMEDVLGDLLHLPPVTPIRSNSLIPALYNQLLIIAHRQDGPREGGRLSALLLALIEEWGAAARGQQDETSEAAHLPLQHALAYMEQHLHDPALTIEWVAGRSGWTHEHFSRMFSRVYGMPPRAALLDRRIRRAEQLLLSEQWTVKRIAREVGFGDEHHFSKMFKQLRGMTATSYRQRYASPIYRNMATIEGLEAPYPINRSVQLGGYQVDTPD